MPAVVAARYRLGVPIGRGGMGRVWRAHDEILDRDVAIKEIVPPPGLTDPEGVHRRTLREARAAARLSHPGVVQVYDVLEVDNGTWIVMEFVPCRSLQEVIAADGPLPPRRVAKIGLDLLAALVAANRAGVEHRDVKPANVLLADDGRVLLTDFGIATLDDDPSASTSDAILGSPEYMAPERAHHGHAGLASDLWSLGATLYTAVEGVSPFRRATVAATLTAITVDDPQPPQHAGPLAPALEALLRKNPADRPSAKDATRLLRSAASGAYGRASIEDVRGMTAPAQAAPAQGVPAQAAPAQGVPDEAAPARDVPAEAAPAEAAPAEAAPAAAAPAKAVPAEAAPAKAVPAAAAPAKAVPAAAALAEAAPAKADPADPGPAQAVPTKADPAEADPADAAPVEAAPAEVAPAEVAPAEVAPAEVAPAEVAPAEVAPAARRSATTRRPRAAIAGTVLALVLVVAAVLWFALRPSSNRSTATAPTPSAAHTTSAAAAAAPTSASTSTGTSTSPSTAASSSPSAASTGAALPKLPAGWHDYHDKTGFSIYVPNGWTRSQDGSMVYFRSAGHVLGIDQSKHPKSDPLADWRGKAAYRVSRGDFPGYHLIRLESVDYLKKSADWEYTFNGSGSRQHVDNRNIVASSHQAYSIYWQTTDAGWSAAHDDLTLIYQSFRPA